VKDNTIRHAHSTIVMVEARNPYNDSEVNRYFQHGRM